MAISKRTKLMEYASVILAIFLIVQIGLFILSEMKRVADENPNVTILYAVNEPVTVISDPPYLNYFIVMLLAILFLWIV